MYHDYLERVIKEFAGIDATTFIGPRSAYLNGFIADVLNSDFFKEDRKEFYQEFEVITLENMFDYRLNEKKMIANDSIHTYQKATTKDSNEMLDEQSHKNMDDVLKAMLKRLWKEEEVKQYLFLNEQAALNLHEKIAYHDIKVKIGNQEDRGNFSFHTYLFPKQNSDKRA